MPRSKLGSKTKVASKAKPKAKAGDANATVSVVVTSKPPLKLDEKCLRVIVADRMAKFGGDIASIDQLLVDPSKIIRTDPLLVALAKSGAINGAFVVEVPAGVKFRILPSGDGVEVVVETHRRWKRGEWWSIRFPCRETRRVYSGTLRGRPWQSVTQACRFCLRTRRSWTASRRRSRPSTFMIST